mmetsp:Transcript_2874/g.4186  ORF Transcript_2874/g.4186 Transcript_2874/m.4186 type:complete len:102 (-) Transcript_2874:89-394(-)
MDIPRHLYQAITQAIKNKRPVFRIRHRVRLMRPLREMADEGYIKTYVKDDTHIIVTLRRGADGNIMPGAAHRKDPRKKKITREMKNRRLREEALRSPSYIR